jgi:hypothetical protein
MSEALHSTNRGDSTTSKDEAAPSASGSDASLMVERLSELTPIQGDECLLALKAFRNVSTQVNEEIRAAYLIQVRNIAQAVFVAHEREIYDAQTRAVKNQPSNK